MHTSLSMLLTFNIESLSRIKANRIALNAINLEIKQIDNVDKIDQAIQKKAALEKEIQKDSPQVDLFLKQMRLDFASAIDGDPNKQADNLIQMFFVEGLDKLEINKTWQDAVLVKLEIIEDFLRSSNQMDKDYYLLKSLLTALKKSFELFNLINKIVSALQHNKKRLVIEACMELSHFYKNTLCGLKMKFARKNFYDLDFTIMSVLKSASDRLKKETDNDKVEQNSLELATLTDGMSIFGELLYGNDLPNILNEYPAGENAIRFALNTIRDILPHSEHDIEVIYQTHYSVQKLTNECLAHLHEIISEEARKLPSVGFNYEDHANPNKINVEALADDLTERTGHFENEANYPHDSKNLIVAVESYQATKRLSQAFTSSHDPLQQLENYNQELKTKKTQDALQSNPDPIVVQFLKKLGYYLANVFSIGLVGYFTQGSPIMTPLQNLNARAQKEFEKAAENQVFNKKSGVSCG